MHSFQSILFLYSRSLNLAVPTVLLFMMTWYTPASHRPHEVLKPWTPSWIARMYGWSFGLQQFQISWHHSEMSVWLSSVTSVQSTLDYRSLRLSADLIIRHSRYPPSNSIGTGFHNSVALHSPPRSFIPHSQLSATLAICRWNILYRIFINQ